MKIPFLQQAIINRKYKNSELEEEINRLRLNFKSLVLENQKSSALQYLLDNFNYPRKFQFPRLIYEFSRTIAESRNIKLDEKTQQQIFNLGYGIENLNIGIFMHNSLESIQYLDSILCQLSKIFHKIAVKRISDKKLILMGDYFHVNASLISSQIGLIQIPLYFSQILEEVSKVVSINYHLNNKIKKEGEQIISIEDIYQLGYQITASILSYSFMFLQYSYYLYYRSAALIIFGDNEQDLLNTSFIIGFNYGLALHFQNDALDFAIDWTNALKFNKNVNDVKVYDKKINLPNYILYQCLQNGTNIHEIFYRVLKTCDSLIEFSFEKAQESLTTLNCDKQRIEKLFQYFLISHQ